MNGRVNPLSAVAFVRRLPEWSYVPPAADYLQQMIDGAFRSGLSIDWIMHLRTFRTRGAQLQLSGAPVALA